MLIMLSKDYTVTEYFKYINDSVEIIMCIDIRYDIRLYNMSIEVCL